MLARSPSECTFCTRTRDLWTDHLVWTRQYIVAAVNDSADAQSAANRLLVNQEQIGQAIVPYYGADAGKKLTVLCDMDQVRFDS